MPDLREAIRRLIQDLVIAEQRAVLSVEGGDHQNGGSESSGRDDGRNDSAVSSSAVIISEQSSEQSFQLLEVKVCAGQTSPAGEDVSDSSNGSNDSPGKTNANPRMNAMTPTEMSSLTNKYVSRSGLNSSFGPKSSLGEDNVVAPPLKKAKITTNSSLLLMKRGGDANNSLIAPADDSTSSETKHKASVNLSRNVFCRNEC